MQKVRFTDEISIEGRLYHTGEIAEMPNNDAASWIQLGYCELYRGEKIPAYNDRMMESEIAPKKKKRRYNTKVA